MSAPNGGLSYKVQKGLHRSSTALKSLADLGDNSERMMKMKEMANKGERKRKEEKKEEEEEEVIFVVGENEKLVAQG